MARPALLLSVLLSLGLAAPVLAGPQTARATGTTTTSGWSVHGEDPGPRRYRPVRKIVAKAARNDGRTVRVEGVVDEVCKKKGCWMTLRTADQMVRVTFKDYGFFVPKDIHGRRVRLEGVFSIREVPVAEARHYLEDAGRREEAAAITEPQQAYSIEATGVRVSPSS